MPPFAAFPLHSWGAVPRVSLNPRELSQLPWNDAALAGVALEEAPPAEAVPAPGLVCRARLRPGTRGSELSHLSGRCVSF